MGCPVFRGSLALDGGLLLPRSDRGPLRGPRCLPHGSARLLALLGHGDRLPREAHLLKAALRSRRPESLFEPALTIYSVHSGKDESCAKTRDNGGVQTFVPGRAREYAVKTRLAPSVSGAPQPRRWRKGLAFSPHCSRRATFRRVVLRVRALPDFVTGGS